MGVALGAAAWEVGAPKEPKKSSADVVGAGAGAGAGAAVADLGVACGAVEGRAPNADAPNRSSLGGATAAGAAAGDD